MKWEESADCASWDISKLCLPDSGSGQRAPLNKEPRIDIQTELWEGVYQRKL